MTATVYYNEVEREWGKGFLFRQSFLCLVPLVSVSVPVGTKIRWTLECRKNSRKLYKATMWKKRWIHLVRSSMSTSMASCSTCSSSLNSSSCTSSSFRPVRVSNISMPPYTSTNQSEGSIGALLTLNLSVHVIGDNLQLSQAHVPHVSSPQISLH